MAREDHTDREPRRGRRGERAVDGQVVVGEEAIDGAKGIVFHDTRHSAVTNLVASGTGEAAACR